MKRCRAHHKRSVEVEHVKSLLGLYRQPPDKTQLIKKLKEIAARKDDVRQEGVGRSEPRES